MLVELRGKRASTSQGFPEHTYVKLEEFVLRVFVVVVGSLIDFSGVSGLFWSFFVCRVVGVGLFWFCFVF